MSPAPTTTFLGHRVHADSATISKRFAFSSSHQLDGLSPEHPCSRLHGHNYEVEISFAGIPDEVGFVIDYRDLDPIKTYIDGTLDHRHLNDVVAFNPTAEHLATHLLTLVLSLLESKNDHGDPRMVHHIEVAVSETPKTWARVGVDIPVPDPRDPRQVPNPHALDEDRYRWNFDTDGTAR